ncbi:MAG: ATP synthase F0 subunit B [Myxococcales bacterium]|nr:ATP synthase F0 subunit B [Myxococcales bacterium]
MEILPDPIHATLLLLPFLVAAGTLHVVLWKPLLAYLDERAHTVTHARHEAEDLESAAVEQMTRIETRLAEARAEISTTRQAARQRALGEESKIVAEARGKAETRVSQAVDEIRRDRSTAAEALRASASELSGQIAAQVLGRSIPN